MVRMESTVCRSGRTGRASRDEVLGFWRESQHRFDWLGRRVFFGAAGKARSHQKPVGGDGQACVMVKPRQLRPS